MHVFCIFADTGACAHLLVVTHSSSACSLHVYTRMLVHTSSQVRVILTPSLSPSLACDNATQAKLVLVIVLPILLCVIWSTVFAVDRLRKLKVGARNLFGQVKPPLEGPDSTLVVT